jgi:bacillithiol system protein YtxJ
VKPTRIDSEDALSTALAAPRFLLLKHSERCGISTRAFDQFESFLGEEPGTPSGFIDVLTHRALSDRVAEVTGVAHESPQALLLEHGQVIWTASHFKIAVAALREALQS